MRNVRILFVMVILLTGVCQKEIKAQTPQEILYSIYGKYDSLANMTFDIKYTYGSDTLYGDYIYDVLEGTYTMYGKKAMFRLGDIEYLQNDSFFVAVYNKDEMIIVADPKKSNSGSYLPLRDQMDSLMAASAAHYTITTTLNDSTGHIIFTRADSLAQFNSFVIEYDAENKFLRSLNYVFTEDATLPNSTVDKLRTRRLKVEFLHHRFDNFSDQLYDENKYVFFENGECKPVSKYAGFRVFYSRTGVQE
jgi:hypothetical protein